MIVQRGLLLVRTLVVSEIKSHIEEHVSRLYVNLHFGCRETVYEPV